MNTLYYGDNLNILRRYIADESVDLVYLDPPSSANRNYNVLFKDESGLEADSLEWPSKAHGIGRCGLDLSSKATRFPKCSGMIPDIYTKYACYAESFRSIIS